MHTLMKSQETQTEREREGGRENGGFNQTKKQKHAHKLQREQLPYTQAAAEEPQLTTADVFTEELIFS